jgi:hypothetical protein
MRTAIVSSAELTTKSLRADHYVANPRRIAQEAVQVWIKEFPFLSMKTSAGKRLLELVEKAVREGMQKR